MNAAEVAAKIGQGTEKHLSGTWKMRCPAHEDRRPSLDVSEGREGRVLVICRAGCELDAVLIAAGLDWNDLFTEDSSSAPETAWSPAGRIEVTYDYTDEDGQLLFQVVRAEGKRFLQRRPDPMAKSGWTWKLGETRRPLYHLPEVIKAVDHGLTIFVCEGEKDVDMVRNTGASATCNPHGAGKWRPEHTETLREADVVVVADKDPAGYRHARAVATALENVASTVRLAESAAGKDVADHLIAGLPLEDLVLLDTDVESEIHLAPDLDEFLDQDTSYDWLIPGLLERGDRFVLTGGEGLGKALGTETPLPTPSGWTTMGEIEVGDRVLSPDGSSSCVIATSSVMLNRPCFKITFSDGSEIIADQDHQWLTETLASRSRTDRVARRSSVIKTRGTDQRYKRVQWPGIVTTIGLRDSLMVGGGKHNHSIVATETIQTPEESLAIPPYTFGYWLGDGHSRQPHITVGRNDRNNLEMELRKEGVTFHEVLSGSRDTTTVLRLEETHIRLRQIGVLGNKHIPSEFLRASPCQRRALLAGLLDSDGWIGTAGKKNGRGNGASTIELTFCHKPLVDGAVELLLTLGIIPHVAESDARIDGRVVGRRWRITFQSPFNPFRLKRKAERWSPLRTSRSRRRYITSVERIPSVPVRCIEVNREDGLYLAGRSFITTHNSELAWQIAVCAAAGINPTWFDPIEPVPVLMIDCENGRRHLGRRLKPLRDLASMSGHPVAAGMLRVLVRSSGLDLTDEDDAAWLAERVIVHKPSLLIIGPLYRLHMGDPNDELPARKIAAAIDAVRVVNSSCAVIIETHSGHGADLRPFGSSLWKRWPEFGYGLVGTEFNAKDEATKVQMKAWRGPRDERSWPREFHRGRIGEWPWVPYRADGSSPALSASIDEQPF